MSIDVSGKIVVVTGTFGEQRSVLESKLSELGAEVKGSISSKTQILFAEDKAGSKLAKTTELGIPVYGEAELMELLGGSKTPPTKDLPEKPKTKSAPKPSQDSAYPPFPTPMPLSGARQDVDLRYGIFAIAYAEPKVHVVDSRNGFDETSFELPAEKGWAVASIRCIRVVLYQDAPHLLIGYTLKADGASESTRAAIGLFGLDGAPVVVHKAEGKHGVDILAQSPDGEFLAWRAGGLPIVATVTDFVTGQNWSPLQTSPYASLVFDNNKFSTNTALAARSNLYSVGNALLGPQYRLRDGKLQKVDSSAWARAVKGDDGDDEFTVYMAAGDGQIACFGPGSSEAPHLCFVEVDSASVLMVQPLTQEIVRLFLENNTLYIVNDSEMVSMPWPSLEQFSDAIQTRKDEPALPLVGVRKTLPAGDSRFPERIRLSEEVTKPDSAKFLYASCLSLDMSEAEVTFNGNSTSRSLNLLPTRSKRHSKTSPSI